jgi:putative DNA primase/helicase
MALEATTQISAPLFENIPEELKKRPQWVCWLAEMKDGRLTKIPYTPGKRVRASSTDSLTWRPFDEAVAAYKRGEPLYHGIGFCFQ